MKKIYLLYAGLLLSTALHAQETLLPITTGKTTTLVFPAPIRHVDRGRAEVLVQQVRESRNLLMVKAAVAGFPETNLSVVTGDGQLYSFLVRYDSLPQKLVYQLGAEVTFENQPLNDRALAAYRLMLLDNGRQLRGIQDREAGLEWQLNGIYSQGAVLFLHLALFNHSAIDFDLHFLKLYLRDAAHRRRTARQERELTPLASPDLPRKVAAGCSTAMVLALPRFVLPARQYLALEAGEKGGGRLLQLKVRGAHLLRARVLPPLQHE